MKLMSFARRWRYFLGLLALVIPPVLPALGNTVMTETVSKTAPDLGAASHVGVGESVYGEVREKKRVAARTQSAIVVTKQGGNIQKGADLLGEYMDGEKEGHNEAYCAPVFTVPGIAFLCLMDKNGDNRFDTLLQRGYKPPKGIVVDVPFERVLLTQSDSLAEAFRRELVYEGAGGGVLKLLYREFSSDMARPAFSQEASYDLAHTGPTEVTFKGARLIISAAGNTGIDYKVLSGFTHE